MGPTLLLTDIDTNVLIGLILGSNVIVASISVFGTWLTARGRNKLEAKKIDTNTDIDLAKEFRIVVKELAEATIEAANAEERHVLERIEDSAELKNLKTKIEKCDLRHAQRDVDQKEWVECARDMLSLLVHIEPILLEKTSQPTLLEAVNSLRNKIEKSAKL